MPAPRQPTDRHVAHGGLRRALLGLAIGTLAGFAAALVLPREEGPRRRIASADRPEPRP